MKTRILHTRFWADNFVVNLTPKEKLLFIYLLTNERVNLVGIYEIPDKYIKNDLDLTQLELDNAKKKFQTNNKIIFLKGWVKIVNHDKYNSYLGAKTGLARNRELTEVPKELVEYPGGIDTSIDTSIDTPSIPPIIINNNNIHKQKLIKTYTKDKLSLEQVAEKVVEAFNKYLGTSFKFSEGFKPNLEYWLQTYEPVDIARAIKNIKYDKFWNGKMTPTILFRRKNPQGEAVDYISQLLLIKPNYDQDDS